MIPLLTFATGIVVGAVGLKVAKGLTRANRKPKNMAIPDDSAPGDGGEDPISSSENSQESAPDSSIVNRARDGLRSAAVNGLSAVERSSAALREKLSPEAEDSEKQNPQSENTNDPVEEDHNDNSPVSPKPGDPA